MKLLLTDFCYHKIENGVHRGYQAFMWREIPMHAHHSLTKNLLGESLVSKTKSGLCKKSTLLVLRQNVKTDIRESYKLNCPSVFL